MAEGDSGRPWVFARTLGAAALLLSLAGLVVLGGFAGGAAGQPFGPSRPGLGPLGLLAALLGGLGGTLVYLSWRVWRSPDLAPASEDEGLEDLGPRGGLPRSATPARTLPPLALAAPAPAALPRGPSFESAGARALAGRVGRSAMYLGDENPADFRLEVTQRQPSQFPPDAVPGGREVALQEAEFDQLFRVSTNEPRLVAKVLSLDACGQIRELLGLFDARQLRVSVNRFRILVLKSLPEGAPEADYVARARLLCETLLAALCAARAARAGARSVATGIVLVGASTSQASARCEVCGEDVGSEGTVRCAACHAPYHQDCWDYVGRCSIFGCDCQATARE